MHRHLAIGYTLTAITFLILVVIGLVGICTQMAGFVVWGVAQLVSLALLPAGWLAISGAWQTGPTLHKVLGYLVGAWALCLGIGALITGVILLSAL